MRNIMFSLSMALCMHAAGVMAEERLELPEDIAAQAQQYGADATFEPDTVTGVDSAAVSVSPTLRVVSGIVGVGALVGSTFATPLDAIRLIGVSIAAEHVNKHD